jgi:hypothetical protein
MDFVAIMQTLAGLLSTPLVAILSSCVVFGAFGGCIAHFINNEKLELRGRNRVPNPLDEWFRYPSVLQSAAIGTGGAIAFLFFIIAVGGLTNFQTLNEQLRSIAVSVIAGFGARSLLPRMVGHLENQIAEAKTEAVEAKTEAEKATHSAREALEKSDALDLQMKLIEAAHTNTPEVQWRSTLNRTKLLIDSGRAESGHWINMARVQRWHGLLDEAIAHLELTIAAFADGRLNKDVNYPTAYYNIACYLVARFKERNENSDKVSALENIDRCLQTSPNPVAVINEMREDTDFGEFIEFDEFKALARKHGA